MKKKLGMTLLAVALFGSVAASTASAGPMCYKQGNVWFCEY